MLEKFRDIPKVEDCNQGVYKQIIAKDYEGIVEQNITTIEAGKEVAMHGHANIIEEILVLEGAGLFSLKHNDVVTNLKLVPEFMHIHRVEPGEAHAIKNLGSGNLVLLVIQTLDEDWDYQIPCDPDRS